LGDIYLYCFNIKRDDERAEGWTNKWDGKGRWKHRGKELKV
jgi:hypothetical protein